MHGIELLVEFDFLPIITMTRVWDESQETEILGDFREVLQQHGYARPRLKVLPRLLLGAEANRTCGYSSSDRVTAEMLDGYDTTQLVCQHSRVVTDRGIAVCPILIDSSEAILGDTLHAANCGFAINHGACATCFQFGAICTNPPVARWNRVDLPMTTLAFFGGIYNNHLALAAAIADARSRGVDAMWCLGDLGAFGPHPDRTCELIRENGISVVQGNYDHSIGHGLNDCQCGYTDPRDNRRAAQLRLHVGSHARRAPCVDALATGSAAIGDRWRATATLPRQPARTNEFLWQSTTSTQFLAKLCGDCECDVILGTHTGQHWARSFDPFAFINVGVLGRPENDGTTNVWYTLLRTVGTGRSPSWEVEFVPLAYDHERLVREMRDERLPEEFIETILTGWWTTCLEVLPSKERRRGRW